jgi:hypothetical protein
MSQTSYDFAPAVAFAGLLADLSNHATLSYRNAEAANMPFGIAVKKGAGDSDAALLSAAESVIAGVTVHTHAVDQQDGDGVPPKGSIAVLTSGRIYVKVEQAVTPADPVYTRFAAGAGGSQKGAFRKDADTATAKLMKGARYLTSAAADGYAVLEVNALVDKATAA